MSVADLQRHGRALIEAMSEAACRTAERRSLELASNIAEPSRWD